MRRGRTKENNGHGSGAGGLRFCEWKKETIKKMEMWCKAMKLDTKRSAPVQSFR